MPRKSIGFTTRSGADWNRSLGEPETIFINVRRQGWGVVITWAYDEPPYIESGEKLFHDMVLAYENGAKYILIFDTNKNYTHGILGEEHFDAISGSRNTHIKTPERTAQSMRERRLFFQRTSLMVSGVRRTISGVCGRAMPSHTSSP